jgi:two-component system phosphate regulon sensor histidine kinase PhoR
MPDVKKQLEKLIERNDELESYFRNTIIPQLFVDANLILRKFTPPAMKQFNLAITDVGKSISDIKDNLRFPSIIENIEAVIEGGEILEKEIQTTDYRWYQMNIIPYVTVKDGKTDGVIITFIEITSRIKDLKELEALIADYENLLDTISHDIKTPLTGLMLSIERLKSVPSHNITEYNALVSIVENGTKKIQKIINELTDTRKQEHKYQAEEELLSFEHILEDVRLTLSTNITDSRATIKKEIEISELTFSRRKLRSILYNLINNAIKFKHPARHPVIDVKTYTENNFTVISVKDNGIGIPADKSAEVFSKYFRMHDAAEGSGIGLYLVKEIVNNCGGKIALESKEGEGSEFRVYLKRQV